MANGIRSILTVMFLLLGFCAAAAAAPGDPIGEGFIVHPAASSVQDNPAIAASGNGFVVVWFGELPGTTATLHARRFTADGTPVAAFPDIEVADTGGEGIAAAVSSNTTGQFAVVWSNFAPGENDETEAFIRSFSADGAPLSPTRALQAPGLVDFVSAVDVGMSATGNIVAVFRRSAETFLNNFGSKIFVRRFAFDASPIDSQASPIGHLIPGGQVSPHIAVRPDGSFVVSWTNRADINFAPNFRPLSVLNLHFSSIRMQPFAADGSPLRRAVAVDKAVTYLDQLGGSLGPSAVAASDASDSIVTWVREQHVKGNSPVVFRPYSASGFPLSLRQTVQRDPASQRAAPDIAIADNGNFAVVWQSAIFLPVDSDLGIFKRVIYLRIFDQQGEPLTPPIRVSEPAANPSLLRNRAPAVAALSNGNFAVTWQHAIRAESGGSLHRLDSSVIKVQLFEGT